MKLVCAKCFQEMEASFIARFQHTLEGDAPADIDGHHISINAQRTWCDGEWMEFVDYDNGGMPFMGGVVGLTRWTLADGRVLERRYDSRKGGWWWVGIWSDMAACQNGDRSKAT